MRKPYILFAFVLCTFVGGSKAQMPDKDAVKVPLENYIKAHATGDPEYARKAFHTEGNMIWIRDGKYSSDTFDAFIKRAFTGKPAADEEKRKNNRRIEAVDITGNAAVARIAAWSRALFGWPGALVSFGLFVFDPNLLAHSTLVTTDIFGALFLLLSLRAFARWLEEPGGRQSLILGVCVGAASISKYTAAYLPIIFIAATALSLKKLPPPARPRGKRAVSGGLIATATALVVINAGFLADGTFGSLREQRFESPQFRELRKLPVLANVPLPVPRPFVEGLDRVFHRERNGGGSGNIYFLGELREPGSEGFPAYFLVVGLLKTPIPAILALLTAAFLLAKERGRARSVDEITLLCAFGVFAIYFSLLFRAQIGMRHFLVAMPPLFVLAGCLGPFLWRSRARLIAGIVALALSGASLVRHGDDPLSYFNELVDPTLTYRIAADSNLDWGQTRGRVEAWLQANPEVLRAPARPFAGRLLVGANQLTGVVTRRRMEWLRESGKTPIGHVAFTHFLFEVSAAEAEELRLKRGIPPLPPS